MSMIRIADIEIGERHRKDMGDLQGLAASIQAEGLLQPIGITKDRRLVYGERRLRACRDILKWESIKVEIVNVSSIVAGEFAENEVRKAFTPSERVAIAAVRKQEIAERRGNPSIRQNFDELKGWTDEFLAVQVGFKNRGTLRQATKVVETGTPELVDAMDQGKVAISTAAVLADAPKRTQKLIGDMSELEIRRAALVQRRRRKSSRGAASQAQRSSLAKIVQYSGAGWQMTTDQRPVACEAVIAQPPFDSGFDSGGVPRSIDELRDLTEDWCGRWCDCDARFFAIFWRSEFLFEGRAWLDESLTGYRYVQVLGCQCDEPANSDGVAFIRSWTPILLYRHAGTSHRRRSMAHGYSDFLGFDLDADKAAGEVIRETELSADPNPRTIGTLRWLIDGLTQPGDQVVCLFGETAACGVAALKMGRRYHGTEVDPQRVELAARQLRHVKEP